MKITIDFDENSLTYTDRYLAALWHTAQINSAPADDPEACRVAELIGREIIRRWLASTEPELWSRQGNHEKSLPAIASEAKVRNVLFAAREVVAIDHGANIASYRERAIESVENLEKALLEVDADNAISRRL